MSREQPEKSSSGTKLALSCGCAARRKKLNIHLSRDFYPFLKLKCPKKILC